MKAPLQVASHIQRPSFSLDGLLTVEELATKLRVSLKTVRSWIYLRKISHTRLGRRVYFSTDVVEELLSRNAVAALRSNGLLDSSPRGKEVPNTQESRE